MGIINGLPPGLGATVTAANLNALTTPSATNAAIMDVFCRGNYAPDNAVFVPHTGVAAMDEIALRAGLALVKTLAPNGAARSHTNRATLILGSGPWRLTANSAPLQLLTADSEYIDIVAAVPSDGAPPADAEVDTWDAYTEATLHPPATVIRGAILGSTAATGCVVYQTANDVRLHGFGVVNDYATPSALTNPAPGPAQWACGLILNAADNSPSIYDHMYFWASCGQAYQGDGVTTFSIQRLPVGSVGALRGTWTNCAAGGYWLRTAANGVAMEPVVLDCRFGPFSIGGDWSVWVTPEYTGNIIGGYYARCRASGQTNFAPGYLSADGYPLDHASGIACFGGCLRAGQHFAGTVVDCEVGALSFGLNRDIRSTARLTRVSAGIGSFAGWTEVESYELDEEEYFYRGPRIDAGAVLTECSIKPIAATPNTTTPWPVSNPGVTKQPNSFGSGNYVDDFLPGCLGTLTRCSGQLVDGIISKGGTFRDCVLSVYGSAGGANFTLLPGKLGAGTQTATTASTATSIKITGMVAADFPVGSWVYHSVAGWRQILTSAQAANLTTLTTATVTGDPADDWDGQVVQAWRIPVIDNCTLAHARSSGVDSIECDLTGETPTTLPAMVMRTIARLGMDVAIANQISTPGNSLSEANLSAT